MLLLLLAVGGFALHYTPYGMYGRYYLERYRPEAGDTGRVQLALDDADAAAAADTHRGYREALRLLADARRSMFLNRKLLARSATYEALFQVRFGEDLRSQGRENRILQRLAARGNDAPSMDLALAAHALREGDLPAVPPALARARNEGSNDLLVAIVGGEHALAQGDAEQALEAFTSIDLETDARSSWGAARANRAKGDTEAYAAAVRTTLERSPGHAGALVASAELAYLADNVEAAEAAALTVVGRRPVGEGEDAISASDAERAAAWTLLGRLNEETGRRGAALEAYREAVEAEPFELFALVGLGRLFLDEQHHREALTQFEAAAQALRQRPLSPAEASRSPEVDIRIGKVRSLLALEQVQQAGSEAEALVAAHPDDPRAALWRGKTLEALEDTEGAIAAYRRSVELAPDSFDGYLAQAQLHFATDAPDEAAAVLAEAREKVPASVNMHRMLGETEVRRNDLPAARRELEAALAMQADDPQSLFLLAQVHRKAGELPLAASRLDRLAAIDASYPRLSLERGRLFEAQGDSTRAVVAYRSALEERPDDLDLMIRLAAAQVTAGELNAAEELLRRVMEERANSDEAEHYLGRIALARGDEQTAIAHLARASAIDASNASHHLYLGWAYLEANNLARSLEEVRRAIELDASLGRAYYVRAMVELRSGAVDDARRDFQRALELEPTWTDALAGLADAESELGHRAEAIGAYERAVSADPSHGRWWYRLGRLRVSAGRDPQARAAFERAAELASQEEHRPPAPEWVYDVHRLLGESDLSARRRPEALAHFRRYLELAPDSALDRAEVEQRVERLSGE